MFGLTSLIENTRITALLIRLALTCEGRGVQQCIVGVWLADRLKLQQVLHVHHSFAVAGRQQRVVLTVDDEHQVPQVGAAPWRLKHIYALSFARHAQPSRLKGGACKSSSFILTPFRRQTQMQQLPTER